jgi:sugar phosphate isomerase/epimerase
VGSWSFSSEAIGMCPATLLLAPTTCSASDVEMVAEASAKAGFGSFSLWASFVANVGLKTTRTILDDAGVGVRVVEAVSKWVYGPEPADKDDEAQLDLAADLGAEIVSAATLDQAIDFARAADGFAAVCQRGADRGMRVAIEFIPFTAIPDLASAWRIVRDSGAGNGGIVLDMVHWYHQPGGPNVELLTQIPADQIHYVQVCDAVPATPPSAGEYMAYAMGGRRPPGEGVVDIPGLLGVLESMGADPYFALEVFNTDLANSGAETMARQLRTAASTIFD